MTTYLLIRHGATDTLNTMVAGRTAGISLNDCGKKQAIGLVSRLKDRGIDAIYSSPLERTLETAVPLASQLSLPVHQAEELLEVDFGEWTGRTLDELQSDPGWILFNTLRSCASPPQGETMVTVQQRLSTYLTRLSETHPQKTLALFTHGDVIRSTLCYYLGIPIDFMLRLEIVPASISEIILSVNGPQVVRFNETVQTTL
jgi:broad specificity phosphatase PhoE